MAKQKTSKTSEEPRGELGCCVQKTLQSFFSELDGQAPADLYNMVMEEVEAPLFREVMKQARDNQTRAAEMLGINRGTLRKKLRQYGLID